MKHLIRGCLIAVVIGVLIAGSAYAGPKVTSITLPTATTGIGKVTDSLKLAYISPDIFTIGPTSFQAGYSLSVFAADTSAFTGDSVVFVLLYKPNTAPAGASGGVTALDSYASTAATKYKNGWTAIYTFAAKPVAGTNFPLHKLIPLDSLAVYPIVPGSYTWAVYGGVGDDAHVMNKAYKFRAIVSYGEAY